MRVCARALQTAEDLQKLKEELAALEALTAVGIYCA